MTDIPWQPSATIDTLKKRAAIVAAIRCFFAERDVLEVETPLLAQYSVTDPHMATLTADNPVGGGDRYFLQTSPEYAMKRLLAAGSGAIYQISKAFRQGEQGSRHNPEFSMLEWYRPGFSMAALMDEIEALMQKVLGVKSPVRRISYQQLFIDFLAIDPLQADVKAIEKTARQMMDVQMQSDCADDWLNLLMAEVIEPKLAALGPVFVYNYPASQAALARIEPDENNMAVARRFELYAGGLELANGYDELTDGCEQQCRFEKDQQQCKDHGKIVHQIDRYLLAAMESGLPPCSGVALGLDRLIMLALNKNYIVDVQAFPVGRA